MTHYELHDKIGEGGMGTVYRGVDTRSGTPVAIKVLKADSAERDMIARFIREGESLRQLNHPSIVKLLDTFEDHGRYYLVMELVEGGSLADVLSRDGVIPVERALPIALDLADALTRAHRLNIIHRDLKPANILIAGDGTPRLTDFGIALTRDSQITETGALIGTFAYLSPELISGGSANPLSDIWAFGVVLFEMITGMRPFQGEQFYAVMNAIVNHAVPDLEERCPEAPVGLIDLIYRMLAKNPNERIPSVRLVGAELEALLQGRLSTESRQLKMPDAPEKSAFADSTGSGSSAKHNLPKQTTPFVGRDVEVQTVSRLLDDPQNRLVTIIAPGGMGKTRLSLEVAAAQLSRYPNGVYFVELAPLTRADAVPMAVADAVQYPFQKNGGSMEQQILDYLREKKQLLVMDNFEHIIDGRAFVQSMLRSAPEVKILVTSRERLNLSGETLFPLEGMSVPSGRPPEEIRSYAAVKLFLQSARRIRVDYEPDDDELPVIGEICRKVYGMPLGIVLAASWLELLSTREIADEITRSLDFLETTLQDVPERQRSLRGLFEYSWNLLDDEERQVFVRLSLFQGGMTREAAQAVSGASLRHLQTLVNKSLLRRATDSGRYEIHELLRQFAEEQLKSGGAWDETRERHAVYFAGYVALRDADIKGKRQLAALQEIETDFENIKTAGRWMLAKRNAELLNRMIEPVYWFSIFRNRFQEGEALFREGRAVWSDDSLIAGRLLVRFPDQAGRETFTRGLNIATRHNDAAEIAFCTRLLGHWLSHSEFNNDEGIPLLEKSLAAYQAMGDDFYTATVLDDLGWSYNLLPDPTRYREAVEQSLAIRRRIGDVIGVCNALRNMGGAVGGFGGEQVESLLYWHEALELARTIGDRTSMAWNGLLIGIHHLFRAKFDEAFELIDQAMALAVEINNTTVRGMGLQSHSLYASLIEEDFEKAYRLSLEAYPPGSPGDLRALIGNLVTAFALYGLKRYDEIPAEMSSLLQMGMGYDEPPVGLWAMIVTAVYCCETGDTERAAELVGLINQSGVPLMFIGWWKPYQQLPARLQQKMDSAAYQTAYERGSRKQVQPTLLEMIAYFS